MRRLCADGGYALVYAVFALTLMSAIVGGVSAVAVRNINTQRTAVQNMRSRYEAEGRVEELIAEIADLSASGTGATDDEARDAAAADLKSKIEGCAVSGVTVTVDAKASSLIVEAKAESGDAKPTIDAKLAVDFHMTSENDGSEISCTASVTGVTYQSFDVIQGGG